VAELDKLQNEGIYIYTTGEDIDTLVIVIDTSGRVVVADRHVI